MADVQMYRFNGSAWVEVNPVPAAHNHDDRYMRFISRGRLEGSSYNIDNMNDPAHAGFWNVKCQSGIQGTFPSGIGIDAVLLVYPWNSDNYATQEITEAAASGYTRRWVRKCNAGVWGPWVQIYSSDNKPSLADLPDDSTHRLVTDAEKATWNDKISVSTYGGHVPQTGQFLYLTPYGWMGTDRPSDWKEIYAGTSGALSEAATTPITVPSNIYAGKTIAVEIRYGSNSNTSYTNRIVFVTLGTSPTSGGSKTYPRYISFSEWDGTYLKNISTKCYVSTTSSTTTIIFGYLKTLIGQFTGTTIDWTTQANDDLNVYIGKIWLVG